MKKILILAILALLLLPTYAKAQTQITKPYGVAIADNQSSTIVATNTFQQIFAASTSLTGRTSCTIQNNGSNTMYVFFGATVDATTAKSVKLAVGQSVKCDTNDIIIKSAVQITGTISEAYYAAQW